MPLAPEKVTELTAKRRKSAASGFEDVLEAWTDPETGAGYVLTRSRLRDGYTEVKFFRPRAHRAAFKSRRVVSNHDRIGLADTLRKILTDEKARKAAPHDLEVGDIIAEHWGVTIRDVNFYRVIDIPDPRKVTMAPIPQIRVSGDWMGGTVTADTGHPGDPSRAITCKVSMLTGQAEVDTKSTIGHARKWDGRPVFTHAAD